MERNEIGQKAEFCRILVFFLNRPSILYFLDVDVFGPTTTTTVDIESILHQTDIDKRGDGDVGP